MSLLGDFRTFLNEYGVVALAVALIIGLAVTDLVNAIVSDIVMPVVAVFLPGGDWETAVLSLASIEFQIGHFFSAVIDFIIILFVIFLLVRYVVPSEEEPVEQSDEEEPAEYDVGGA